MTTKQMPSCPLKPIWSDTTSPSAVPGEHYITDYELCSQERCAWWVKWEPGLAAPGACAVKHLALKEE